MNLVTCQHEWVKQCQLRYRVDPPTGYRFEDAHYPEPECRNGTETVKLWYPDHIVHGALQTLNLQHPCMHGYRIHVEQDILQRVYPEYLEIYKEAHKLCQSLASRGVPKSEEHREKIAKALKGKTRSKEHCENISKAKKGVKNHKLQGRTISDETRRKQSEAAKKRYQETPHPRKGRTHSDETKKKVSEANKGKTPWNKGLKSQ